MRAHEFAPLVGKYVAMERDLDEVEHLERRASGEGGSKVSFAGTVALVRDVPPRVGGDAVEIVTDYGMAFLVVLDMGDTPWSMEVYADEATFKEFSR